MTRSISSIFKSKLAQQAYFAMVLLMSALVQAATINLANAPLNTATTSLVLPNLMYVLDNSGSMSRDFMPDYIDTNNKCKDNDAAGNFDEDCDYGDPAWMTNDFNSVYYNPKITYLPGVNANGTSKASMTNGNTAGWTAVLTDPYRLTSTTNLIPNAANTEGYPDRVWCNTGSPSTADRSNTAVCKQNNQYTYPTNTYDNAFTLRTNPFYYNITPAEWCTTKALTACQATKDAAHSFPARYRWCNNAALTNCQATYTDLSYNRIKWLGITNSSSGSIQILAETGNTPSASPTPLSVTGVTVAGVSIIPAVPAPALTITDTTIASQRNSLAAAIATNINNFVSVPNYAATSTGDVITITQSPSGASLTASIVVTTTTATAGGSAVQAVGSFRITNVDYGYTDPVYGIQVGSTQLLSTTIYTNGNINGQSNRRRDLANKLVAHINGNTTVPNYTASSNNANQPTVTITAAATGAASAGNLSINKIQYIGINNIVHVTLPTGGGGTTYSLPTQTIDFNGGTSSVSTFNRVDIVSGMTYPKASTRTDCFSTTCTYAEEMTNFANWYSYYRTRILMMKSSTSLAFKDIDDRYRVGFTTLSNQSSNYLSVAQFDGTQKTSWYAQLFSINPGGGTPLRSALANVGRQFAGQKNIGNSDPVQYSCQQNFTLLTTDGYWNTDSSSSVRNIAGTGNVGNQDNNASERAQGFYEGPTSSTATLADAAKYYYETDLRNAAYSNCTGAAGVDVCLDNVFVSGDDNNTKQHMTTFTLGLGVNGLLDFSSDYKTQTSGDFFDIKNNTKNWSVPVQNNQTTVDDLWHAAVNGRGTYFSAKDPTQLSTSLSDALRSINAKKGAGAAAATSTLQPVAGDNFAYVASYETVKWTGNLEARSIDLTTGEVGVKAEWCLHDVGADSCTGANSSIVNELVGGVVKTFCKTTGSSALTCVYPSVLDGSNNCRTELATFCQGTMPSRVAETADQRNIFINNTGALVPFTFTNLSAIGQATNFTPTFLAANLSQWSVLTGAQQAAVTSNVLVNYLRGQTGYEDRSTNLVGSVDNRIFRFREGVIGDALDSPPTFNGVPKAKYTDAGFGSVTTPGSFANTQASREGTIYIGTNDGMLHAINAENGNERWAFVPTAVIPNMWRLADDNYSSNHTNYVNGDITINDICVAADCSTATASDWRTILVGGLNSGGKGYYALDITIPDSPVVLWEFDQSRIPDLGFSFGNPIITKKANGTWVVLLTSGYNNIDGPTAVDRGKGYLYVVNALTGVLMDTYSTGVGDATTPSGLAKIRGFIQDSRKNNTVLNVYGGDLQGNVWRFDINSPQTAGNASTPANPFKLAKLQDASSNNQPITVKPELATVSGKRLVVFGTGKYLEVADLTDTAQQSIYAFTDESFADTNNLAATLQPRVGSAMVNQTIANSGSTRTASNNAVDYTTNRGWYVDLPDSGERQNVPSQLVFGALLVPTIVPSNTVCSPGGYGWLNFLDFKTGGAIAGGIIGTKTNAPIVGINVLYINGQPKVSIVTADNPTPTLPAVQPSFAGGLASGFKERRVIWRELIDE